jgi:hypothetical protein
MKTAPGAYRGFYANMRDAINGVAEKAENGEAGGDGYGEFEEGSDIEGGV